MDGSRVRRKLVSVSERLSAGRQELAVLDEQLAVLQDAEEDARVRALVSETPLAERELNEASRHAAAMRRSRNALVAELERLQESQAELLERLPSQAD